MQDPDYKRPPFPIAWARKEGKGRVYYNAMGHREDIWTSERFHQILAGAVGWATGRADAQLDENMSATTPQAGMLPRNTIERRNGVEGIIDILGRVCPRRLRPKAP